METSPTNFVIVETDAQGRAPAHLKLVPHFKRANNQTARVGDVSVKFALEALTTGPAVTLVPLGGSNNSGNVQVEVPSEVTWPMRQLNAWHGFVVILAGMVQFAQLLYAAHLTFSYYRHFLYAGENAMLPYWQQIAYFLLYMSPFAWSILWWKNLLNVSKYVHAIKMHTVMLEQMPASNVNRIVIWADYYILLLHKGLFCKMYKAVRTLVFYGFGAMILMALMRTQAPELQGVLTWLYEVAVSATGGGASNSGQPNAFRRG
jgi:hypothetical protein